MTKVRGENGAAALSSTSDPRLDLFFALVRNLPDDRLCALVRECFADSRFPAEQMAADVIVMAFQTRNCRGGKGERELFLRLFLDEVFPRYPRTALELLPLVPHYGSWKDAFALVAVAAKVERLAPVRDAAVALVVAQLRRDVAEAAAAEAAGRRPSGLSLAAKWAPREGRAGDATAGLVARAMFPEAADARARYRRAVAGLNRALGTVEVHMAGQDWGRIDPCAVPSLCLNRKRKAFLNEKCKAAPPALAEAETGNRFPLDAGRVACRKRVRAALLEQGTRRLKGKQLFPHEIVRELMGGPVTPGRGGRHGASDVEREVLDAQWGALRQATKEALLEAAAPAGEAGGRVDLGKVVALVDVSGSMSGTPMEVAIALGILISELAAPTFAHRVLTFESQPRWVKFEPAAPIGAKVAASQAAPWGGSTNFAAAMERILEVCVAARLAPAEIPDLLVLSDMQFDEADGGYETHLERLRRRFAEAGRSACGEPWPLPQITFWNLRGDTVGFPAAARDSGVRLISGFAPALLKLLLAGEPLGAAEAEEGGEEDGEEGGSEGEAAGGRVRKAKVDPLATLRKALDDAAYDPVRAVLSASQEGALAAYAYTPAPAAP